MRVVHISFVFSIALAMGLSAASAFAETLLRVHVVDNAGSSVHKAEVRVGTFQDRKGKRSRTNREGIAQFKKLKDGYYRVWVRSEGFKPGLFEFVRVSGEAEKAVKVQLQPGFDGAELYFESPGVMERAKQLGRDGFVAIDQQQFQEAEAKLKESLSYCPSDPETHKDLALAYVNLEKWELAEESLDNASDYLVALVAVEGLNSVDAQEQREEIERLRGEIPARRLASRANKAMNDGDYPEAAARYEELSVLQPENSDNHYYRAVALARAGRGSEALQAIDAALAIAPDNDGYRRFKLSVVGLAQQKADEAAAAKLQEIEKLVGLKDYQAVLTKAEEAREGLPEEHQPTILLAVARANAGLGNQEEAVDAYQRCLALEPDNSEARMELIGYLLELTRYDEAFQALEGISAADASSYDQSLLGLARQLMQKGKQEQATRAFEKVLEVNPECAEAYYELGVEYYYGAQDNVRAKKMLQKYLELGEDPELLDNAKTLLKVIK